MMKSTLIMLFAGMLATASATSVAAAPIIERSSSSDTFNEWSGSKCGTVGVIFARGTFDSGNVGVWVGPQFFEGLKSEIPGVALQGVDPKAYPADLSGYLSEEGGSNAGAASMAKAVNDYAKKCPGVPIVLSGWSQGAIVAHKAAAKIDSTAQKQIAGLVTFGDPNHVWDQMPLPSFIPSSAFSSSCVTGSVFDPLCATLPSDFKIPTSVNDIIGPFKSLPSICKGIQETEAAASLVIHFPSQLLGSFGSFVKTLRPTQFVRLLLTPQHFTYGNNGMAKSAAAFVAKLPKVTGAKTDAKSEKTDVKAAKTGTKKAAREE